MVPVQKESAEAKPDDAQPKPKYTAEQKSFGKGEGKGASTNPAPERAWTYDDRPNLVGGPERERLSKLSQSIGETIVLVIEYTSKCGQKNFDSCVNCIWCKATPPAVENTNPAKEAPTYF